MRMPSAYGHANGPHLVNANSIAALTNGQTPAAALAAASAANTATLSPHRGQANQIGPGQHSGHHVNQNQQAQQSASLSLSMSSNETVGIREVWAHNMEEEFVRIRKIVQHYPFVAMDTEFPGCVAKPVGTFTSNSEYLYQIMRSNITLLKIIQIGLTFMNAEGKKPDGYCTWQFNFRFNLNEDMYAQESIELLTNSGIQFSKHDQDGIDPTEFAVLLIGSGVVLSDNISWLSFHSGYDFGYLLKILTDQQLPKKETEFFELLKIYFPRVYDLKYLMKSTKDLKGGLQEVAEQLALIRKGPQHQAGSDSLLTGETFFKLKEMYFENDIEEKRYSGFIYGLETAESGRTETDDDGTSNTTTASASNIVAIDSLNSLNNINSLTLSSLSTAIPTSSSSSSSLSSTSTTSVSSLSSRNQSNTNNNNNNSNNTSSSNLNNSNNNTTNNNGTSTTNGGTVNHSLDLSNSTEESKDIINSNKNMENNTNANNNKNNENSVNNNDNS